MRPPLPPAACRSSSPPPAGSAASSAGEEPAGGRPDAASSAENVRVLVQEEGRAARNLLVFNVLVDNKSPTSVLRSPRRQPSVSPRTSRSGRPDEPGPAARRSAAAAHARKRGRARSVSAGRGSAKDLHARYWAFLFENLRRAVDEIYQTCETDDSVLECKETIMILERCTQDFRNLIEWLKIKWEFDHTPKPQRPASVAWEIRKTSPGKLPLALVEKKLIGELSRKQLAFEERPRADAATSTAQEEAAERALGRRLEEQLRSVGAGDGEPERQTGTEEEERRETDGDRPTGAEEGPGEPASDSEKTERTGEELPSTADTPVRPAERSAERTERSEGQSPPDAAETAARPARTRQAAAAAGRPRGSRPAAASSSRPQSAVSPRSAAPAAGSAGGARTAPGRSATAGRGARTTETRTAARQQVPGVAVKSDRVSSLSRRPARGSGRTSGPPPVRTSAPAARAITTSRSSAALPQTARSGLQRSATVCSDRPPAPAQVYSSCVKSHSNSSLSSTTSSSGHSWADRVKGIAAAVSGAPPAAAAETAAPEDDGGGWETVKSRSRSRLSPLSQTPSRSPLQRKGSAEATCGVRPYVARTRFQQPTSAVSLPSLSSTAAEEEARPGRGSSARRGPARRQPPPPGRQTTTEALRRSCETVPAEPPPHQVTPGKQTRKVGDSSREGQPKSLETLAPVPTVNGSTTPPQPSPSVSPSVPAPTAAAESTAGSDAAQPATTVCHLPADTAPRSGPARDLTSRDLTSPVTPRDLTSPELDEDSVDEEMVLAERALQSAIVEERHLEQQLAETELCVIEVDTETDGDSTSADTECEGDSEDSSRRRRPVHRSIIEEQFAPELESLSWGDRMDMLEELEDISTRAPGRGLQMHEKLSSPSRKKALSETIRLHRERQEKASHMRQTLMEQKTQKLSEISIKIEEVRHRKEELLEQRRVMLERKMARADEKRRKHLQDIVRRAHDEEEKAKEIAFINKLEAKNKRHEFYSQIQEQEARLAGIQEERQRRVEEKAAKEAAVEEKRKALEQERRVKLEELKQKRKERLERIHREQQDKEKERLEMAREKQRDRDERLSALHAAQQATAEELQRRIQQKQEESARRHEENMEQIRQRALELSVRSDDTAAQLTPYDTKKMCTLCNVLIGSEVYLLSHLRGRQHQEAVSAAAGADLSGEQLLLYNLRHITDAAPHHIMNMTFDRERHKTLKKRCKKIKARMVARQEEFSRQSRARPAPVESPHRAKLAKAVKELSKVAQGQGRGPWPNAAVSALDRTLGEVTRILDRQDAADQSSFCASGGLTVLSGIIDCIQDELSRDVEVVPARTVGNVSRALAAACRNHPDNCTHMVNSNMVGGTLDLLMTRLSRLSSSCAAAGGMRCDPGAAALMQQTAAVLSALTRPDLSHQQWAVLQDLCSYLVCVGTVDKMASFFSCVQDSPDSDPHLCDFLVHSLRLLRAMAALLTARYPQATQRKDGVDRTGLIATLQVTQLAGIVSMLYAVLLRRDSPAQRGHTPPPRLDDATLTLAAESLSTLLQLAKLDLHMFQVCLGFEGRSLEFRHVTSYLLWYCSHHERPGLLRLVIQTTGYFTARCYDNQMVMQKGAMPTVLQQLLTLPFSYFSDPQQMAVLFPSLLACCQDNAQTRAILQNEMSFQILEDFLRQESSRSCHLVQVLLTTDEESASVRSDATSCRSTSVASS